ncbi:hypothetical protein [Zwartia sp.]|uniref:hypothetical protein n=1 Tax=Zwartia sp. TaxID=2978004 RepID=UPI003BB010E7
MKVQINSVELHRKESESIFCFLCAPTYLKNEDGFLINFNKLNFYKTKLKNRKSYGNFRTISNVGYYNRSDRERYRASIDYFASEEFFHLVEADLRAGLVPQSLHVKSFDKVDNNTDTFADEFEIRELEFVMTPKIKNTTSKLLSFFR